MIVRSLEDLAGTERETQAPTFTSRRFILARDGLGFSFHDTVLYAGTTTPMQYLNHVEAVYCIEGEGELTNVDTGEVHTIRPGVLYAVDQHERHQLSATTDLRMMCVFNPPLTGQEVHDEHHSYPLLVDEEETTSDGAR